MRTTIDLPADLHRILTSLAASSHKSLSQAAVQLMQSGLEASARNGGVAARAPAASKLTGLPQVRLRRVVTPEDVRALDDEG
jgi:hypothetical protein